MDNLEIIEKLNILYVEDEIITKDIVSQLLQNFCSNVKSASNGKEAYDIYKNEKIDLIITDLEMPKTNGLDLISKIRTDDYAVPIIVFTAYTDKNHLLPCANLNIQGYVEKPISYEKLEKIFENVLSYLDKKNNILTLDDIKYDSKNSFVLKEDEEILLNKKEKMLLDLLLLNKNSVVSYEEIEIELWEKENDVMTSMALRTLVKNLRKKTSREHIENISGLGYKLNLKS